MQSKLINILFLFIFSGALLAQDPFLSFDDNAGDAWGISLANGANKLELNDNFDDASEGDGALEVYCELNVYDAAWGTWTDAKYVFPEMVDLSAAEDIRFKIKILKAPSSPHGIQFTCDLLEQPDGASGEELWRWQEDLDIFYSARLADEWYEIIIPLDRLRLPSWFTPINGELDLNSVTTFAFGVHGDSTAADTIRFLMDDLVATTKNNVANMLSFDDNSGFATSLMATTIPNSITLEDNFDDAMEGDGALEVEIIYNDAGASWGAWTDAALTFETPIDLTGATEYRFMMKVLNEPDRKNIQFTCDIFDNPDGAAGLELWRWNAQYGLFHNTRGEWVEVVIPFDVLAYPSWYTPQNAELDLEAIQQFAFGMHIDDSTVINYPDTVVVLFDDMRATSGTRVDVATALGDWDAVELNQFALRQNYPNPFNPSTNIEFNLDKTERVSLKIYNVSGQLIKTVVDNRYKLAGNYSYDVDMSGFASGIYYYRLVSDSRVITKKMTLIK